MEVPQRRDIPSIGPMHLPVEWRGGAEGGAQSLHPIPVPTLHVLLCLPRACHLALLLVLLGSCCALAF